jgi:hypothetical protein
MAAGKGGRLFGLGARPAKIGSPSLTAGDTTDTFSWSAPNNNGLPITKYGYQTSTDNGSNWSAETETANLSAVINTQYSTSAYKIRIRAFNAAGYGEYSDISTGTAVWISNTGTETDTDTVCGPAGCSDTENVTETDTENVTETDTDTVCGPEGCSQTETQNCECGTQSRSRTRTSSRTRTRPRSRDRTRVRSRTRTRTSSRTRTRSTQFYSRSGSTSSAVTYGSYSAYTDYTYSAYGAYGTYSYTEYTGYGSYYYTAYGAYTAYSYTAYPAYGSFSACNNAGTNAGKTGDFSQGGIGYTYIGPPGEYVVFPHPGCSDGCNWSSAYYTVTTCSTTGTNTITYQNFDVCRNVFGDPC